MPLIPCPECGREISTAAEACPQCGHPNHAPVPRDDGPSCYACSKAATTRCQRCGELSCAVHLQNIFVRHGRGGGYELRCRACYDSAVLWRTIGMVLVTVIFLVFAIVVLTTMTHH